MIELSRFNSAAFDASDSLAVLQDVYSAIERVDIEVVGEAPPHYDVLSLNLPGASVLEALVSPMSKRRTRAQAADGKDDVVVSFITSGRVRFNPQGADEFDVAAGEAYLGYSGRPSHHSLDSSLGFMDISIPRAQLAPRVADLDRSAKGVLPGSPELALLGQYARMLMHTGVPLPPELAAHCQAHLIDLATLALGPRRDAGEQAKRRGLPQARVRARRADIEAHVAESWFSLDAIARRHGISPQYLRALFYRDGTSFSDFVRDLRLDRAMAMLTDPRRADHRISDIAYASGFGDLSHFNLSFRRRFGLTPSAVRAGEKP